LQASNEVLLTVNDELLNRKREVTCTEVNFRIPKHSSIDTMPFARLRFYGMEVFNVINRNRDAEFWQFADRSARL